MWLCFGAELPITVLIWGFPETTPGESVSWGGADINGTGVDITAFYYIVGTFDGSSLRLYKDGSLIAGPVAATPATAANPAAVIGSAFGAFYFNGDIR